MINAFQQIRLNNRNLDVTGNNLYFGGNLIPNSGDISSTYATIDSGTNWQNQLNSLNSIKFTTGSGTSLYIPKFAPGGSGLINSNIIDSGNQIQFGILGLNNNYSGIFSITPSGDITFGQASRYNIGINSAGTYLNRPYSIAVGSAIYTPILSVTSINSNSSNSTTTICNTSLSTVSPSIQMGSGTYTHSASITGVSVLISPRISQTVSAGYKILHINPTITSVGSGNQYLVGMSVDNVDKFVVTSSGNVGINNSLPISALDVTGNIYASGIQASSLITIGAPPSAYNSVGTSGTIRISNDGFIYVATGTSLWGRVAVSPWP